jgi:hypothetical protein
MAFPHDTSSGPSAAGWFGRKSVALVVPCAVTRPTLTRIRHPSRPTALQAVATCMRSGHNRGGNWHLLPRCSVPQLLPWHLPRDSRSC